MSDVKVLVLSAGLSHLWLGEALALTRHGGPNNETLTMCIYGHKGSTVFGVGLIVRTQSRAKACVRGKQLSCQTTDKFPLTFLQYASYYIQIARL